MKRHYDLTGADALTHYYKFISIALALLLAALLVPMLLIACYDVPSADDYSFGARAHTAFEAGGSFFAAIKAAFTEARIAHSTWQGTFSAIFLMALQPAVFGESLYALTAPIMLCALIAGCYLFCSFLFGRVFGAGRHLGGCVAALLCIMFTQLPLSSVQGFYWYNGAVYYTFFYGLTLAALALGIALLYKGGAARQAGLALLLFFIGGGNYVTMLTLLIIGASAVGLLLIMRDARYKRFILPLAALATAAALSMTAPGNAVRQANYTVTPNAIEAVLLSFESAASYFASWTKLPQLGMLALMAALMWPMAVRAEFSFRFPALVTLWSWCLYSAMFCPPIYAMGDAGDYRLLNIIYFTYLLALSVNLFYWMGWLAKRLHRRKANVNLRAYFASALTGGAVMAVCMLLAVHMGQSLTSVSALYSLRTGEAAQYRACAAERYEILHNESIKDAVLPGFPVQPYVLYYDDITFSPTDWRNLALQTYYEKSSVVISG